MSGQTLFGHALGILRAFPFFFFAGMVATSLSGSRSVFGPPAQRGTADAQPAGLVPELLSMLNGVAHAVLMVELSIGYVVGVSLLQTRLGLTPISVHETGYMMLLFAGAWGMSRYLSTREAMRESAFPRHGSDRAAVQTGKD